jgi:hypothetical protein
VIDTPDIRTTDCGCLYPEQDLAMTGTWYWHGAEFNSAVARQKRSTHALLNVLHHQSRAQEGTIIQQSWGRNFAIHVPKVFPGQAVLPQKHLAFDEATIPVNGADSKHFFIAQRIAHDPFEIAENVVAVG